MASAKEPDLPAMMAVTAYELIKDAIVGKKIVTATYRGRVRVMCPHTLGTKHGRQQALFYQFAGESSSGLGADGDPENWRCMFLVELSNLSSTEGEWHTAPNHSRPQTCVDVIDVEAAF
jgi:hypothetical protein